MDKTTLSLIALLVSFLGPPIQAQSTNEPSASTTTSAPDRATHLRLPDTPSPHQSFVLPPNPEAGIVPKPRTELTADHEYTLTELVDIAERENPETRVHGKERGMRRSAQA